MAEQEKSIVDTGTGIPELDSIMNAYSRASRGVHDTEWWGEEEWEPIAEAFTKAREAWNKRNGEGMSELEPPKCEYCGATRRECSGCGAEVGHTVFYGKPNTRSTDESDLLGRVRKLYDHTKSKAWSTKSPHYKYAVRIRELFPELFLRKPSEEEA